MRIILIASILTLISCEVKESESDYYSKIAELNTKYPNGNWNSISFKFNDDDKYSETDLKTIEPILVNRLKKLGYKTIETSFFNYSDNNSRALKIILRRDSCNCAVYRIYENSKLIDSYRIEEKIRCYKNT